jgi:sec-independent protein translocase protein TatA
MHFPGLIPLLIVLFLAFLLFGRPGRLSGLMEDLGKGIKGFRKGLGDENKDKDAASPAEPPRQLPAQSVNDKVDAAARDKTDA